MDTTQKKTFCLKCNTEVSYHQIPTDHRAHLRTTLFTLGVWVPFWLLMSISKHYVCDVCGENVSVF